MSKQKEIAQTKESYSNRINKDGMHLIQETQLTKAADFAKMIFSMQKTMPIVKTK